MAIPRPFLSSVLLVLILALSACTSPATPGSSSGSQGSNQGGTSSGQPTGPKVLVVATQTEPATLEGFTGEGGSRGGAGEVANIVHSHLTMNDPNDEPRADLAAELPSVEKGTWKVNPDGSMDMTWKIREGVKWHDGTPMTASDIAFSFELHKDEALAHAYNAQTRIMESATATDPQTLVVHWTKVDVRGLEGRALTPFPRHLMEAPYRADKSSFITSPLFTSAFVGLGPYKMSSWTPGSQIEFVRNDSFFMGRPPLDRVIMRFIGDGGTMVANFLSESVDLIIPPSIELESALEVKRRVESAGHMVRIEPMPRVQYLELQFRPEFTKPVNGQTNLNTRQGLYQALDRQQMAEVVSAGLAPAADSWYRPSEPLRREVETAIPQYPFDVNRAQQLLSQGGWTKGSDGILTHTSGERFEMEIWTNPQASEAATAIIASSWRTVGVDAKINIIPPARSNDREYLGQHPGPLLTGTYIDQYMERLGPDIANASNRWSGRNRSGYANPRFWELVDQLSATVDPRARTPLLREQVSVLMGDIGTMPLFFEARPILQLKTVKADVHPNNPGWNVFTWDKQ
jgi:peptide/nickel transport system substrate-binding protein